MSDPFPPEFFDAVREEMGVAEPVSDDRTHPLDVLAAHGFSRADVEVIQGALASAGLQITDRQILLELANEMQTISESCRDREGSADVADWAERRSRDLRASLPVGES